MELQAFPPEFGAVQEFDVLVIGGGLAGICAAIAAARLGRRVALVHDRPVLGGNASSEHQVNISGADCSGHSLTRYSRETGIIDELALDVFHRAADNATARYIQDWVFYEHVTREPNATLFLNAKAVAPVMTVDGRIRGVTVLQVSTERKFALASRILIDCSGDGRIAAAAGAEFRMGREARSEFDESMAPDQADTATMGSSLEFIARDMGRPVPFTPPAFARHFPTEESLPFRRPVLEFPDSRFEGTGWWWLEYGGQCNTIDDNEAIRDELIAVLFGLWDLLKNRSGQGLENYALEWIATMPGRRESRRFMGDVILTENDVRANRKFEDAIAYSGWPIDVHPPQGVYDPAPPSTHVYRTDYVTVPLRCLYSRNIPNLFFAGRNVSVTHVALGTTRVMATCALFGQAAGTAAHLCLEHGLTPRELARTHTDELQQLLLRHDCYIPGCRNRDAADCARAGSAAATSSATLDLTSTPGAAAMVELTQPAAQLVPATVSHLSGVELLLEAEGRAELHLSLVPAAHIHDVPAAAPFRECSAVVEAGAPHWVRFDTDCDVTPGTLCWFVLDPAPGVSWATRARAPVGTVRSRRRDEDPAWHSEKGAFCLRTDPVMAPYGPENVLSGSARPEEAPHLWVSDPAAALPQTLRVRLAAPRPLDCIQVTFDDDLDTNIYQPAAWGGALGRMVLPTLVRAFRVLLDTDAGLVEAAGVADNRQRRCVVRFPARSVCGYRIEVQSTWGDPSARIYETRAYLDEKV